MVVRKVFASSENDSLPDQHVPLYRTVNDLIYNSESIDNVLGKMRHAKTDEGGSKPAVACLWFHIPMNNLSGLLDLKQKQANLWEARSSREGAEETARQGSTIFVFTVVTIIFLPLPFMTSFFALGISAFPQKDGEVNWPLGYVLSLLFGISSALIFPAVLVAFHIDYAKKLWKQLMIQIAATVTFRILQPLGHLRFKVTWRRKIFRGKWIIRRSPLMWWWYRAAVGWIVERYLPRKPDNSSQKVIDNAISEKDPLSWLEFWWEDIEVEEGDDEIESEQRRRQAKLLDRMGSLEI
ncbi:hypothetical protein BK809_0002798 [Diplodia seriata]|uniref:Uncharacterized protein n=1 Tax=Diplodia seriata TaxID=420778 RepID=A0A1S8BKL2_9PEZI|nr:hypothetical protein BK809_0002798 [Diplodia seriata]